MTCISYNTTKQTNSYTKTLEENFELRDLIKKEIISEGTKLFHIDKGTIFVREQSLRIPVL